jgi:predicted dithiol-disulfide oxidoreductase (DUF899 family)
MKESIMKHDGKSKNHTVVAHDQWIAARKAFLAKEKEFTLLRDELSRQRRELPWELVEKPYVFDGPSGKEALADLFAGRSQLIVHHFMFGPDWDVGCKSCSFWADNYDGIGIHLKHRDISFVSISRAPLPTLEAYKQRMGWRFKWVSSLDNDFNFDFNASFTKEEIEDGTAFWNFWWGDVETRRPGHADLHSTRVHRHSRSHAAAASVALFLAAWPHMANIEHRGGGAVVSIRGDLPKEAPRGFERSDAPCHLDRRPHSVGCSAGPGLERRRHRI